MAMNDGSDNMESYKRMYEMGQELMDMAKECGYDPDSESEDTEDTSMPERDEDSGMMANPTMGKKKAGSLAMAYFARNK